MSTTTLWLRPLSNATVLATAAVYGFFLLLGLRAGLFGIWLLALTMASLWRYCYTVLRAVAQGRPDLPPPDIESMNPIGRWRELVHFALFAGLFVLGGLLELGTAGRLPGVALLLIATIVFPASAALMGVGMGLVAAVNPVAIAEVIRDLGRSYLDLVVGCICVVAAAALTVGFLLPRFGWLSGLAGSIVAVWTILAVFALIGSTLRAHKDIFDIPGAYVPLPDRQAEDRLREWRAELDLAYAAIRSGKVEEGYRNLGRLVDKQSDAVEILYWLFENMIDWEQPQHAFRIAERLAVLLIDRGELAAAMELYLRCRRAKRAPELSRDALRQLADYAEEIGQLGVASEIRAQQAAF
jgi:hypothetical protein